MLTERLRTMAMLEATVNQILATVAPLASRLIHASVVLRDEAETASTDGAAYVYMPAEFCDQPIPGNEAVSVGLLAHESSHFLQPLKEIQQVARQHDIPHWLVNLVLDIQGETLVQNLFPSLGDPLSATRKVVHDHDLQRFYRDLMKVDKLADAACLLALVGRFVNPDVVFDPLKAAIDLPSSYDKEASNFLHLLYQAGDLPPGKLAAHLVAIIEEFPALRQTQAVEMPLDAPNVQVDAALAQVLSAEVCAVLSGWSQTGVAKLLEREYSQEPPRPEAVQLAASLRTRFEVRRASLEILAPGRLDRREAARGQFPYRMAVTGSDQPAARLLLCVDVSSSMWDNGKQEAAFIAAQAVALSVQQAGGEVVGLLFDQCAGVARVGDASPLFAPRSQWNTQDGTSFLFLPAVWRRWPQHRVILITDGRGEVPHVLPNDRTRTVAIVIPPGSLATLHAICSQAIQLDNLALLPSVLTLLTPVMRMA